MSYRKERDEFIAIMSKEGVTLDAIRLILRNANTIQRLAAAKCNGDYPCDNGERKVKPCIRCEAGYVPYSLNRNGVCPQCRAQDRIAQIAQRQRLPAPVFSGDPRGSCVILPVPSGRTNDWGRAGICVPTRNY